MDRNHKMRVKRSALKNLQSVKNLEHLTLNLEKQILTPHGAFAVAVSNEKRVAFPLSAAEGTILTYVMSGCAKRAHVEGPHQTLLSVLNNLGMSIVSITIESKHGDMSYARMMWTDRRKRAKFFRIISVGDALVYSLLANTPITILRRVLDDLEDVDDIAHDEESVDF
jgi:bifunctional DNase/RNase